MARSSLRIVVGLVVPPRTVGSLAMTRHCVCATSASATTTPPPTGSPVCSPASGHSSSTGVPGSTSASRRSRTIILPRARWRSTYCGPPPASTSSCSARTSSTSAAHGARRWPGTRRPSTARRDRMGVLTASCPRRAGASPGTPPSPRRLRRRRRARPRSLRRTPARRPRPAAGSERSSSLVARTAPGADLARGRRSARPPRRRAPPRPWRPRSRAARPAAASAALKRSPVSIVAGQEAAVDDAQRRHQDHRRRHADPDLGEGEGAPPPPPPPCRPRR